MSHTENVSSQDLISKTDRLRIDIARNCENNSKQTQNKTNKKKEFLGIVTSADIRRGFLKGFTVNSSILKVYNSKPLL